MRQRNVADYDHAQMQSLLWEGSFQELSKEFHFQLRCALCRFFRKAFDSVNRNALWRNMKFYGIRKK